METTGGEEDILMELDYLEKEKEVSKTQDPLANLYKHHPEAILDYQESVIQKLPLKQVPPDSSETPDPNHKSQPFLTQYEKTRILGFRTNQLAQGAIPYVSVVADPEAVAGASALEATAGSAMPVRASIAAQAGPAVAGATMPGLAREPEVPEGLP